MARIVIVVPTIPVCYPLKVIKIENMNLPITQYEHHGQQVHVLEQVKGRHRRHSLCYACNKFKPEYRSANCEIANAIYDNCVDFGVVTPVYECPSFVPKPSDAPPVEHPLVINGKPIRRIYIAGPMRRHVRFNFPEFDRVAALGRSLGYEIISPAELSRKNGFDPATFPENYDWSGWFPNENPDDTIRQDFEAVMSSDAVALLKEFGPSLGATFERTTAMFRAIPLLDDKFEPLTVL